MDRPSVDWTAIVVTCQTRDSAQAIQHELEQRQSYGVIPESAIVLAIEDPQENSGSGGATLNALLVVAEHISARRNFTIVNPDVLYDSRILVFHLGRHYIYEPSGRAFLPLPLLVPSTKDVTIVPTLLDVLLFNLSHKIAVRTPPGVWVCSTDMLLDLPDNIGTFNHSGMDVCVIGVPATIQYVANRHGIYNVSQTGDIKDILFRAGAEDLEKHVLGDTGMVPLASGVMYFSPCVAEAMLSFHSQPPLDACTYMGTDSGAKPIQLSLFYDLLLAMCEDVTESEFVSGSRSDTYGLKKVAHIDQAMPAARQIVWNALSRFKAKMFWIPEGRHTYLEEWDYHIVDYIDKFNNRPHPCFPRTPVVHSYCKGVSTVSDSAMLQNTLLGSGCKVGDSTVISNSHLGGAFSIGKRCLVAGINSKESQTCVQIGDGIALTGIHMKLSGSVNQSQVAHVVVVFGIEDRLRVPYNHCGEPVSTFCHQPWSVLFSRTKIQPQDLWPNNLPQEKRNLWNARLFPVYRERGPAGLEIAGWLQGSPGAEDTLHRWRANNRRSLREIISQVDISAQFTERRALYHDIGLEIVTSTLLGSRERGLLGMYRSSVADNVTAAYLSTLDNIACTCESPGVAARTLANIADVLGAMARGYGGMRSGPAGNRQWARAFKLLEDGDLALGVRALAEERARWLARPELLVRAARHYEGATQILIRHAVMTARQFIKTTPCDYPPVGVWVLVESPARVDIAGGWSDTPPITYEHGGAVINAAITLDGKRPIGAKVRRTAKPVLVLHIGKSDKISSTLTLTHLEQLGDYNNPQAPGALLKAAFCCAEIVDFPSSQTLGDQLMSKYSGGFELQSWSNLPTGSGLGTSSILAGVIMAALWKASGQAFDTDSLNHAVAHLEQMLTTGGGWQDQVGGLMGGIKVGHSAAQLPMKIDTHYPNISPDTVKAFSDRLILVYTGKTRLARNLLQNVLRNWYARSPQIVQTEDSLVRIAWSCAKAFEQGDIAAVGCYMSQYWELKKLMAPGSEPQAVTKMMTALKPHVLGMSMAGAGGGGFLYVLARESEGAFQLVKDILANLTGLGNYSIHHGAVDDTGLRVTVQNLGQT